MIYWKIRFDHGHEGSGWLVLNSDLVADRVTDDDGNTVTGSFGYTVVETDSIPGWAI